MKEGSGVWIGRKTNDKDNDYRRSKFSEGKIASTRCTGRMLEVQRLSRAKKKRAAVAVFNPGPFDVLTDLCYKRGLRLRQN